jgi:hypothetical protein
MLSEQSESKHPYQGKDLVCAGRASLSEVRVKGRLSE